MNEPADEPPFGTAESKGDFNDEQKFDSDSSSQVKRKKFLMELRQLLEKQDISPRDKETEIIWHLRAFPQYTLSVNEILRELPREKFPSLFDFLETTCPSYRDLILTAARNNDMKAAQELTHFSSYLMGHMLTSGHYLKSLTQQQLPIMLLDEIVIYNGINYDILSGGKYLQNAIENNGELDLILRFINTANLAQLNAQDTEGNTALHKAAYCWENTDSNDLKIRSQQIINSLLARGVNTSLVNAAGVAPTDLTFFNNQIDRNPSNHLNASGTSVTTKKTKPVAMIKPNKTSFNLRKITVLTLTAIAVTYFGYRLFYNQNDTKIINQH